MDNTIHVNSMSRLLNVVKRSLNASGTSFGQALSDIANQSLESYKTTIEDRISLMPVDATRNGDNFRIDISDAGYEAMMADPAYEQFVLDSIASELATANPMVNTIGHSTVFLRFGAQEKEFRVDAFRHGDGAMDQMEKSNKKSYWEERQERQEAQDELNEKIADTRAAAKKVAAMKLQRGEKVTAADLSAASEIMSILLMDLLSGSV